MVGFDFRDCSPPLSRRQAAAVLRPLRLSFFPLPLATTRDRVTETRAFRYRIASCRYAVSTEIVELSWKTRRYWILWELKSCFRSDISLLQKCNRILRGEEEGAATNAIDEM